MGRLAYASILALISVACAVTFAWSLRSGGSRRLWLTWIGAALVLSALGIFDWRRVSYNETPLGSYILAALLPTLLSAAVVRLMSKEGKRAVSIVVVSALLCFLAAFPAIILGMLLAGS